MLDESFSHSSLRYIDEISNEFTKALGSILIFFFFCGSLYSQHNFIHIKRQNYLRHLPYELSDNQFSYIFVPTIVVIIIVSYVCTTMYSVAPFITDWKTDLGQIRFSNRIYLSRCVYINKSFAIWSINFQFQVNMLLCEWNINFNCIKQVNTRQKIFTRVHNELPNE